MDADKFYRDIARRVREARDQSGMTQRDVGRRLDLTPVGYGHLERGKSRIGAYELVQLSHILGRSVEYFLGLDNSLSQDEDQLLTLFRVIPDQGSRQMILGIIRSVAAREG